MLLFCSDFYHPFCQKFGDRIVKANSKYHTLAAPIPNEVSNPADIPNVDVQDSPTL